MNSDDTGARHKGKNGYYTYIGNESFSWFESTESKILESPFTGCGNVVPRPWPRPSFSLCGMVQLLSRSPRRRLYEPEARAGTFVPNDNTG